MVMNISKNIIQHFFGPKLSMGLHIFVTLLKLRDRISRKYPSALLVEAFETVYQVVTRQLLAYIMEMEHRAVCQLIITMLYKTHATNNYVLYSKF